VINQFPFPYFPAFVFYCYYFKSKQLCSYAEPLYLYTNQYSASLLLDKNARLKHAKEEAEKEIAEHRAHLENQFQKKVSAVC
jgi:hypothetical protein